MKALAMPLMIIAMVLNLFCHTKNKIQRTNIKVCNFPVMLKNANTECLPNLQFKDMEFMWSNSQPFLNISNDVLGDILNRSIEQKISLNGEGLSSKELEFIVNQLKILRSKNNKKVEWIRPNELCQFPFSEIFENLGLDTLFSKIMRFNGSVTKVNEVKTEKVIKQNRIAINANYYSAPALYAGYFGGLSEMEKMYIFKIWALRRFDPEQQWALFEYNFIINYDTEGWLQSAIIEAKVADHYYINLEERSPTELFYIFSEKNNKDMYPRSLTSWHWRYLPSFESEGIIDVFCLKRHLGY